MDTKIPISFQLGLDEKTDSKQIAMGKLLVLENGIFSTPGLLQKRTGLDTLGNTINPSNVSIQSAESLSVYNNQLLSFNGTKAYSYIDADNKWIDKGNISSVINKEYQVVRNGSQQSNADAAKIDNYECFVYLDSGGGIRYSIMDAVTGNFLISNAVLATTGIKPIVLSLANQFVILFVQGITVKMVRLHLDSLLIKPVAENIITDLHENQVYDATVSRSLSGGVEFCNIFLAYTARKDFTEAYLTPKVIKITDDTFIKYSTYLDNSNVGNVPSIISVCPILDMSSLVSSLNGPTVFIAYYNGSIQVAKVPYYIGQLYPKAVSTPLNFDITNLQKISCVVAETPLVDRVLFKMFFEFFGSPNLYTYIKSADLSVSVGGEITAVSSLTNIKIKKGVGLYSRPFVLDKVYFNVSHESYLQSTYFTLNADMDVVSKFNENNGGGLRSGLCSVMLDGYNYSIPISNTFAANKITHLLPKGNGIFKFPTQKKGKIDSENNIVFSKLGISCSVLDFKNQNNFLSATLNDNLYVVGGILQNYDGNRFTEAGFNLYPEASNHGAILSNTQVISTIIVPGSIELAQVTEIEWVAGNRIKSDDVYQINSANNYNKYFIWFRVDGIGVAPSIPGFIPLEVNINSYYTSIEVAGQVASVLNLTGDFTVVQLFSKLTVTNTSIGSAVAPATISVGIGNIAAGTYQYVVIWKYIDNQGRVHRSTTSVPQSITTTLPDSSISIVVPVLSLTSKKNVIMEVYRTENLGSLFRRVSSTIAPTYNIDNQDYRYKNNVFIDTVSDADMLSNELLYTTGDVLDNSSIPACSLITTFDNRLWIAGMSDKNSIQFSKTIDPLDLDGIGGFSDSLIIRFTNQGGNIIAVAKMDDKLIIFKEREIYYISGTGPSNANDGNNYNPPTLISSDVGCSTPNSIVLMPSGLMFKTTKGIYKLDRGLTVTYAGMAVEKHNNLTITSAILVSSKNQVRFTTASDTLVYDYVFDQWSTFTNYSALDADVFNGKYVMLSTDGSVKMENDLFTDNGKPIKLALETGNLNLANIQGYQRFKRLLLLGEFKGGHNLKISFAYNFSPIFTETATFDMNTKYTDPATVGEFANYEFGADGYFGDNVFGGEYIPYEFRVFPTLQKCTSFRVRIEDDQSYLPSNKINEGFNLSNINIVVGIKGTPNKLSSTRSKGTN